MLPKVIIAILKLPTDPLYHQYPKAELHVGRLYIFSNKTLQW